MPNQTVGEATGKWPRS